MVFLKRVKILVDYVVSLNQKGHLVHLAIASLIPRPRKAKKCDQTFVDTDEIVKRYTQENKDYCSFLDLSGLLRFPDGRIRDHLFYDGVHINMMASRWLAEWIKKFIARVPRKKY